MRTTDGWMHNWLDEVEVDYSVPGLIRGDDRGAIALMKTTKDHGKVNVIIYPEQGSDH